MEGRKKGNVLFNDALNTFYFTVIWRQTYGKGPLRKRERKPAAATWATLSEYRTYGKQGDSPVFTNVNFIMVVYNFIYSMER